MDETPYPVVADLLDRWAVSPPVHVLLKLFMGGEDEPEEEDLDRTPFTLEELKRMAGQ